MRSTIAFFMMDWISDGENNLLFTLAALATQNLPSTGIYSSHASAFVPSNNSSKEVAIKEPTFIKIRSAVLEKTFTRQTASVSPINVTLPSSTLLTSYPKSIISFFSTASKPKWHGAINSNFLIPLYYVFGRILVKIPLYIHWISFGIAGGSPCPRVAGFFHKRAPASTSIIFLQMVPNNAPS